MKLNSALVARALDQIDSQAIPDDHPAVPQLNSIFGDHTFFLGVNGLHIVEPTGATEAGAPTAQVIALAEWKDANRNSLVPHEPKPTEVVIVLDAPAAKTD